MPFQKGHKLAPGGKREGAGRTPSWFREQCQKAIEEAKGIEFARDVLAGKDFPQLATGEGEVIPLPPALKERIKALEWLTERGYGKPEQPITGPDGESLNLLPTDAVSALTDALRARVAGGARN